MVGEPRAAPHLTSVSTGNKPTHPKHWLQVRPQGFYCAPADVYIDPTRAARARAKQRLVELPLVISDHADWDELTRTMTETGAEEIWVTHGREEALVIMRKDAVSRRRRSRFWGMKKTKANKAAAQGQLSSIIGATDS